METVPEWYGGHSGASIPCLLGAYSVAESLYQINEPGDINEDFTVDIIDIVQTINIILFTLEPFGYDLWASDVDNNSDLNILDIILIVNMIL